MLCIRGSKSTLKECWLELVVKISQYDKIAMNKFFWRVTQVRQTIQWKSKYYPAGIYLLKVNHSFVPALMPIRPRSHGRYIKENPLYVYKVRSIKTHNLPTLRTQTSFCISPWNLNLLILYKVGTWTSDSPWQKGTRDDNITLITRLICDLRSRNNFHTNSCDHVDDIIDQLQLSKGVYSQYTF